MNYNEYIKYKNKYLNIKNNNILIGGNKKTKKPLIDNIDEIDKILTDDNKKTKKCLINDTDKLLTAGYNSIVIITKNKHVYKMFPIFYSTVMIDTYKNIKMSNDFVKYEIKMFKLITRNIINKNISKHFVKYIGSNKCTDAKLLFDTCSPSYIEFLKLEDERRTKLCSLYFQDYQNIALQNKYNVIEIEYCNYSCIEFIKDISSLSIPELDIYLDILFFQIIHTLVSIKKIYPYFQHNDLYMRNILGSKEKDNGNYYRYKYNNKIFFVPQKKFFPKINDFGLSNLTNKYKIFNIYNSEYKDIYNIMMDIYKNGEFCLTTLCKDDEHKLNFFKSYFSNFFNVDIVDDLFNRLPNEMWSDNIKDIEFVKYIEFKSPDYLLNNYFYNIYNKINKEILNDEI